ncbi:MAG: hypothetical protein ACI9UO_001592 [Nitrospinales bacterium]|jgi:hypothetical protein
MNMENHQQSQFNHEEWINRLFQFIETARQFSIAFTQAFKTLFQKGLAEAWKEIRTATNKLSLADFIFAGTLTSVAVFGGMILLAGIGLLSYQSFLWLQSGVWTEYPMLTVFNFLFENTPLHQWIVTPESWIGMQKLLLWVLESIPVSLALMVPGFSITIMAGSILIAALVFRFYQFKRMK